MGVPSQPVYERRGGELDPQSVKLYTFDEAGTTLERLPLAARRALDLVGIRLSLADWQDLPQKERVKVTHHGSQDEVDLAAVRALVAVRGGETVSPRVEPRGDIPPDALVEAYAPVGRLSAAIWSSLSPLDQYVLDKVAERVQHRLAHSPQAGGQEGSGEGRLAATYAEVVGHTQISTHLRARGGVQMVNVGVKSVTKRRAEAETSVSMSEQAFELLASHQVPKGDVLSTARIAGIMAAKRTSDLIPLCHTLLLTHVGVDLKLVRDRREVEIVAVVETTGKTGVEMEALVAASTAALTIYDMLKASDRAMQIGPTRLVSKSGGASGDYQA